MNKFFVWLVKAMLDLFGRPNVNDEVAFKQYCKKMLGLANWIAELTPSEVDDKVVDVLSKIVKEDKYWVAFYAIVVELFGGVEMQKPVVDNNVGERAASLSTEMNVPFKLLLQLLIFFYELFMRLRKN